MSERSFSLGRRGPWITLAVEGIADRALAERLTRHVGLPGLAAVHILGGKHRLDQRLPSYNYAARHAPWLVLRDLDHDADCAPELGRNLVPEPAPGLLLRIPVRSMEAWLLADREAVASFLGLSAAKVPRDPESLDRPKRTLVDLARSCRKRARRLDMVPPPGHSTEVGPAYTACLIELIRDFWNPEAAATHSESLARTLAALRSIESSE